MGWDLTTKKEAPAEKASAGERSNKGKRDLVKQIRAFVDGYYITTACDDRLNATSQL
jgi:ribosomal protein S6